MELFRLDIEGDMFYVDLDTTIVDDPTPLFDVQNPTMLRGDYDTSKIGSGVMFWPEGSRHQIWDEWTKRPDFCKNGDQQFIQNTGIHVDRWQDVRPGMLVSYKCGVRDKSTIPEGARIVYFHGKPRPWDVPDVASLDTEPA